MFKTQVEPQAAGEWFHCQVLNIFMASFYKGIDHRKLPSICFKKKHGKSTRILFIIRGECGKVTSDAIFIVCTLIDTTYEPISA